MESTDKYNLQPQLAVTCTAPKDQPLAPNLCWQQPAAVEKSASLCGFDDKDLDQHFQLFCQVLERGLALHTGTSNRLMLDFELRDTSSCRHLPRIRPRNEMSFVIPEACLLPSDYYLYYDPSDDADFPQLASYCSESGMFAPVAWSQLLSFNRLHERVHLPLAKLTALRGIHYLKDIACLQLFELDFDALYGNNPAMADQLRALMSDKISAHVEASRPWLDACRSEEIALRYLANS